MMKYKEKESTNTIKNQVDRKKFTKIIWKKNFNISKRKLIKKD